MMDWVVYVFAAIGFVVSLCFAFLMWFYWMCNRK
jgi:hypothetical protein